MAFYDPGQCASTQVHRVNIDRETNALGALDRLIQFKKLSAQRHHFGSPQENMVPVIAL